MNTSKTPGVVIGAIALVAAVIALFVGAGAHKTVTIQAPEPAPAVQGVASNQIASSYFEFGGVGEWAYKQYATNASTTCSFPAPATTTVALATADFSQLASTTVVEIAEATALNATTTLLARQGIVVSAAGIPTSQNGEATVIATTTVTAITDGIIYPGQRVTVKIGGADTQGTVPPIGTCTVKFRRLR